MTLTKIAVPLVVLVSLGGCVSVHDGESAKTALVGSEWVVEDIAGRGVIDDARATLLFDNNGRVSGDTSCNRYFAEFAAGETEIQFRNSGVTKRACSPAVMDQESRFLAVFNAVDRYRLDDRTRTLVLSTPAGTSITARRSTATPQAITYRCTDGSLLEARYPTSDTARITHSGRSTDMTIAVSASGARYVGGGLEWWTKGMKEGTLSRLALGETVASDPGLSCTAAKT